MKHLKLIIQVTIICVPVISIIIAVLFGLVPAITTFLCLSIVNCLIASWLLFLLAISRKIDKSFIFSAPHNAVVLDQADTLQRRARYDLWREQVTVDEISIKSADDLKLHAVIVRNKPDSGRWVVVCHGYADIGKAQMMYIAQSFHEMGYSVLMPDARGHGKSEGDTIGMGWLDRMDILQWIREINMLNNAADNAPDNPPGNPVDIVLYGISLGAATVLMASGEPLPSSIKAIVADSGYTSAKREFTYQLKMLFGLPAFPIIQVCSLFTRIRAGYWLGEASALKQIAKSITPVLLIHGSADTFVPPSMLDELYESAVCPKQKMLVEGAGHGQSPIVNRQHYWQTISDFIANI